MTRMMCSKNLLHIVRPRDPEEEKEPVCEECGAELVEMKEEHKFLLGAFRQALKEAPVPQGVKGACRVRIKLCTACGAPIWRGTDPIGGKHSKVVLDDGEDDPRQGPPLCRDCEAIRYRYPELYFWVNNTAFWRRNRMDITRAFSDASGGRPRLSPSDDPMPPEMESGHPGYPPPPPQPDTSKKRKKVKAGAKKKAAKRRR